MSKSLAARYPRTGPGGRVYAHPPTRDMNRLRLPWLSQTRVAGRGAANARRTGRQMGGCDQKALISIQHFFSALRGMLHVKSSESWKASGQIMLGSLGASSSWSCCIYSLPSTATPSTPVCASRERVQRRDIWTTALSELSHPLSGLLKQAYSGIGSPRRTFKSDC